MRFRIIILLLIGIAFSSTMGVCEKLNHEEYEQIKEGIDYTETYKEVERNDKTLPKWNYDLSGFKYLFYFIIVAILVILLIKIISNFNSNVKLKNKTISVNEFKEIEEKILEIDLQSLLDEALRIQNFEAALRINFLMIIKALSNAKFIIWEKDKTNWKYYSEIRHPNKPEFKAIIQSFERIWYGEHKITEIEFKTLRLSYDNFRNSISHE